MNAPLLHRQLLTLFRQWIHPRDIRHLVTFSEAVAAILQAESSCLSHLLPFLSHRPCQARSHLDRLSYLLHNPRITPEIFWEPLLRQFLSPWQGMPVTLTLDTSMLWDQFCLVEVCLVYGGRSVPLAQKVLQHGSASVAFQEYAGVLEAALRVLPEGCEPTLLADRGFQHGQLIDWLRHHHWHWAIRAKTDLLVTFTNGCQSTVGALQPSPQEVHLCPNVTILTDITCNLSLAHCEVASDFWAVISSAPPSILTFELYGQRFGGIEPHFKDYKSAAFELTRSGIRNAEALGRLLLLVATATIIAISLGVTVMLTGKRQAIDWHGERGLSCLQLGLRQLRSLCYQRKSLPPWQPLPTWSPPAACASLRKHRQQNTRIEFSKVTVFAS